MKSDVRLDVKLDVKLDIKFKLPRLVIPMGDPSGIGPEVVLKALADDRAEGQGWSDRAVITLAGDRWLVGRAYTTLKALGCAVADPAKFDLLESPMMAKTLSQLQMGVGNAASGEVGFRALEVALDATIAQQFDAIVTGPIAKSAWKMAGHLYPGQTEVLADRSGCTDFGMAFVGRSPYSGWTLRALLATTHIPLNQVSMALTPELMTQKLNLLVVHLKQDFKLDRPTIAIAGLNPHSGEMGQLGTEEVSWLNGWLDEMRSRFPQVTLVGLLPPDTMWVKPGQAWFRGTYLDTVADGFLALYHDQGLIPVKLMAFDRAVNTTIGLPFVRTSPDHGTAFDIAGRGIADATSMIEAIDWAVDLVNARRQ